MSCYRSLGQLLGRLYLPRSLRASLNRQSSRCICDGRACITQTRGTTIVLSSSSRKQRYNSLLTGSQASNIFRGFHSSSCLYDEESIVVKTPPFAESVTEGDIRWDKAVGDAVAEDEVVGEIETDKTSIPVTSPASGIIEELFVDDGDKVEKEQQLFKLRVTGEAPSKEPKADDAAADEPAETKKEKAAPAPTPSTPSSTPKEIPTSPPPVPPVPKAPLHERQVSSSTPEARAPASAPSTDVPARDTRSEHRVKMNRMRQRIAQRLKDSQNTYAMLTTFNNVDMSNAMEMRKAYKDAFLKKYGLKLGFMSVFVKAAAYALQSEPVVNAVIEDNEIVYRDYVDISVAVSTPKGLVVPVIRNVETMNFADIEKTISYLGEKARNNDLAIEDMDGGTFTISNGGVFGSMMGTPIINPPQSAILGMHAINDRPVAINGKVEIRPMMYVALTYDHRLIDGREAVTFLRKIKAAVEDPRVLMLDL
ncbi:dihydrolipoyllysine-residue succinyltransferase component of 2-oxoglutarate dehydrogenase complex, mitochondrial-like [Actinia tenebrosa]|uniref:Dihydrolipoyllysine-residue succinyltransferase component of 2-oxoglutarate dehydrogenase complex, mitochondrial n=1 Tax=Actinia tenebrosa TaxID=6105 RepID=A0A6P8ISU4_ACTTE|nr:dihydrolipoyllysine-residue succinyltransferase component of 2-oxoglutarate dehydrogenase complex, mitochondrial-like [Actinia tenebrosa]